MLPTQSCGALGRCAVLLTAVLALPARATETELGPLPQGQLSEFEVRESVTEPCLRHVFDPSTMAAGMPDGYRLARLSELANAPWIAELLRRRPELADMASGAFCFIESSVHTVNGSPVHAGPRSRVAFMWADMIPIAEPRMDERFRGAMRRVQLFWMYDSEGVDRDLALTATPNALFGRINIERSGEVWRLNIQTDDGELTAEVTPTTPRRQLTTSFGHETVPLADTARDRFTVITFAGHHERLATGQWRASGSAQWARTFVGSVDGGSFIQDGWAAHSRLYRYEDDRL